MSITNARFITLDISNVEFNIVIMIRTTLTLPGGLHQRLLITSKQENRPFAQLVRDLLEQALTCQEKARAKHMYNVLKEVDGIGGKTITGASTTIDRVLYDGDHPGKAGHE